MHRLFLETTYHPLHLRRLQTSPFLSPDSRTVDCLALDSRPHHWRREQETGSTTVHKLSVQGGQCDSHGLHTACVDTCPIVIWMDKHWVLMVHRLSAEGRSTWNNKLTKLACSPSPMYPCSSRASNCKPSWWILSSIEEA